MPEQSSIATPQDHIAGPRWLAQMAPWLLENQSLEDASSWERRFYAELKRLNNAAPISIVHDWHATAITPLAIEMSRKPEIHRALQALHVRARAGGFISEEEWKAVLKPAFLDANAFANANAPAQANPYGHIYAYAFADAAACADAGAKAYADVYAGAYASGDAGIYADANTYACAGADAYANALVGTRGFKRLADGLIECLARLSAPG